MDGEEVPYDDGMGGEVTPDDDMGGKFGDPYSDFDEENTFSTDYLTDEELMDTPIDEDVIPNEGGQ